MKRKQIHLMLWAVVAVFLLVSCTKVPKSAKLIPDDAMVVMRFDVKQLVEKSGFNDESKAKKKLTDALKEADMSREAREKVEAILDDPAKAGIDLRDPLFFYGGETKSKDNFGLVGSILSKGDFTDLLNIFAKEAGTDKVKEKDNISYFVQDKIVLVYNDDCFYIGERAISQDVEAFVADIKKRFDSDGKQTMAESDDMKKMCASKGVFQLLFNGAGLADHSQYKRVKEMMSNNLKMEDVSYLMDLSVEKGEAMLTTELIAKSDAWKEQIKKGEKLIGDISGDITKYISSDGFAAFANIDGAAFYDLLKDSKIIKEADADGKALIEKVLTSIKGDMAMDVVGFNIQYGYPIFNAYIKTSDNSIVSLMAEQSGDGVEKTADGYALPLAYDWSKYDEESGVVATTEFGYKNNMTYFVGDAKPVPFKTAAKPFPVGDIKGKGFYAFFNFEFLNKMAKDIDNEAGKTLKEIAKQFDIAEMYYDGDGKAVLRVTMKDKEHTPLESLMEQAFNYFDYTVQES